MATKTRIIRPLFHQSAIVFGVRLTDWKWIAGAAIAAFMLALMFKLQIRGFHLGLPSAIFCFLGGATFFNWVRLKRRPLWLEHQFSNYFRKLLRRNNHLERCHIKNRENSNWLLKGDGNQLPS